MKTIQLNEKKTERNAKKNVTKVRLIQKHEIFTNRFVVCLWEKATAVKLGICLRANVQPHNVYTCINDAHTKAFWCNLLHLLQSQTFKSEPASQKICSWWFHSFENNLFLFPAYDGSPLQADDSNSTIVSHMMPNAVSSPIETVIQPGFLCLFCINS